MINRQSLAKWPPQEAWFAREEFGDYESASAWLSEMVGLAAKENRPLRAVDLSGAYEFDSMKMRWRAFIRTYAIVLETG